MKEITIRSVNENDEVIDKSNIRIEENDVIILKHDGTNSMEIMSRIHKYFCECLKNNHEVISMPNSIEINILKIN